MNFRKNPKQHLLSVIVCFSIAFPIVCLPLGIRKGVSPSIAVRRAYAATIEQEQIEEQNGELVQEWATDGITVPDVGNLDSQGGTTEDGLIDISNGGTVNATYTDGYEPSQSDSTAYADIATYTIVQQYDEANLPIELLDPEVFTPDNTQFYIQANDSILKEYPDMSSNTLETLSTGEGVIRVGIGDTWSKIQTEDGQEGYVLTTSITDTMVWIAIDRTVWVDADSLSLRAEPSTASELVGTLPRDTRLTCSSVADKWYKVTTDTGLEGYVYISYTTQTAPPTPTPTPTRRNSTRSGSSSSSSGGTTGNTASLPVYEGVNGQSIVNICVSMLGVDYVWAGESSSGVDCSGLVVYAYRQIGISVPHQSQSIVSCGVSVSRSDIKPGDVVCWNTGGGSCGHVGIYVGGGQVIHASNSRDNVCYGSVDMMPILTIRRFVQ